MLGFLPMWRTIRLLKLSGNFLINSIKYYLSIFVLGEDNVKNYSWTCNLAVCLETVNCDIKQ